MDTTELLSRLELKENMVECIYVFGSHAYGTASEQRQSDYDIVMVLRSNALDEHPFLRWRNINWFMRRNWINPCFHYLFSDESNRKCFFDFGDRVAQVWMFNVPTFCMLLQTNTTFAIECIFLPTNLKWIEKRKFSDEFKVDDKMLTESITNHSRSHLFMACKNMVVKLFPTENDEPESQQAIIELSKDPIWAHTPLPDNYNFYKTKKLIWHSIRLLYFGIDIKRFGRLTNYTSANHLYEDLIAMETHKWIDFQNKYMTLYNELAHEFANLHKTISCSTE